MSPQALDDLPAHQCAAMKTADPVPRTQPYSNLVAPSRGTAAAECERIGKRRDGRERRRVEHADHQQRREASRRQQAESNERGKRRADGEDGAKRLREVGERVRITARK